MKILTTTLCLVLLTLFAASVNAQNKQAGRSSLFTNLPSTIDFTEAQLSRLFTAAKGENIAVPLSGNFILSGSVTSKRAAYTNLQTLVLKLPAFDNSLFSISKQTENNTITYVGRILNPAYADGFELKRLANGNYQLNKINVEKILTDCSL